MHEELDATEFRSIENLESQLRAFEERQASVRTNIEAYRASLKDIHRQQDKLQSQYRECKMELERISRTVGTLRRDGVLNERQSEGYDGRIREAGVSLREAVELMPRTGSVFLWLLLGRVNVVIEKYGDRFHYKGEYERFKRRLTIGVMAFSALMPFLEYRIVDFVFSLFLVYYYLTMILREHILIVNGSRINVWWTFHHYASLVMSVLFLTWPDGKHYESFRDYMWMFSLALSIVQLLQIRYQMARLYTLRAMGRASVVDVAEEMPASMSTSLAILYPLLFVVQIFELYLGYALARLALSGAPYQAGVGAVHFFVLGIGNLIVTFRALSKQLARRASARSARAKFASS